MEAALIDTDILSEVLKRKNPQVLATAESYLDEHLRLAYSAFTVYEVIRGLREKNASRQLSEFLKLVSTSEVLPVTLSVLMRASELWADARYQGLPHNDADLIIAATALEANRVLVTGNRQHFDWIPGLTVEDWREA